MAERWRRMLVTGVSSAAITVSIAAWASGTAVAGDTRELTFWQAVGKKPGSIFHFKTPTIVVNAEQPPAEVEPPMVSVATDQPPLPRAAPRSRVERQALPAPTQAAEARTLAEGETPKLVPEQSLSPPAMTSVPSPLQEQMQPGEVVATGAGGIAPDATQAPPEDKSVAPAQAPVSDADEDRANGGIAPEIIDDNSNGLPIQTTAGLAFCFLAAGILIGGGSVWKYGAKLLPPGRPLARENEDDSDDKAALDPIRTTAQALPPWMRGIGAAIARQYDPSAIPAWMASSEFRASLVTAAARRAA